MTSSVRGAGQSESKNFLSVKNIMGGRAEGWEGERRSGRESGGVGVGLNFIVARRICRSVHQAVYFIVPHRWAFGKRGVTVSARLAERGPCKTDSAVIGTGPRAQLLIRFVVHSFDNNITITLFKTTTVTKNATEICLCLDT